MPMHITRALGAIVAAGTLGVLGLAGVSRAGVVPASAAGPAHRVTAYVTNLYSGTVTPINTAPNVALKPVKVGSGPDAIAITPDGKTAYVANFYSGTVT